MEGIKKVILKVKSGSSLYGTNTEQSDTDYIGVFIPTDTYIVGLNNIKQIEDNIISKVNGKNTKNAVDCTYYDLKKFLNLCLQGNPNILEILFVNNENIVEITEEGKELLSLKECFVSEKVIKNTYGYIESMKKKLDTRQSQIIPLIQFKECIEKLCKDTSVLYCEPITTLEKYPKFKAIANIETYIYRVGKYNIPRNSTIKKVLKQLEHTLKGKTNRQDLIEKYGYDTKSAYHIARLYYQIMELLTEKQIVYPLRMAKDLMKIRTGEVWYSLFLQMSDDLYDICKLLEKKYTLPKSPDFDRIDKYCQETIIKNLKTNK